MKALKLYHIWVILLGLTMLSAAIAQGFFGDSFRTELIILLAFLKIYFVSFHFMELKKAHAFWQAAMILFMVLLAVTLGSIL